MELAKPMEVKAAQPTLRDDKCHGIRSIRTGGNSPKTSENSVICN